MPSNIIYKDGGRAVDIVIPAAESIAVATRDTAQVHQVTGFANQPTLVAKIGTVQDGQTVFGPYTDGTTVRIHAQAGPVYYQVGVAPVVTELKGLRLQEAPFALNATGALTAAGIMSGIVTSTTAAGVTATLATGAVMDLAGEFAVDDSFDWSVVNTGGFTFTVTASAGHTIVGTATVITVVSATFRTRKTAADTFVTYRLT
jgi:hypothetical protein